MRKFKFMSKAVVGMMTVAMTMGSLSGVAMVQPVGVYAAKNDLKVVLDVTKVEEGQESEIIVTITKEDGSNVARDYDNVDVKVTDSTGTAKNEIVFANGVITVPDSITAGTYTVTVTDKDTGNTAKNEDTATFQVVEPGFLVIANKTEVTEGTTETITLTAGTGIEGEVTTEDDAATFALKENVTDVELSGNKLTIPATVPANTTITVVATKSGNNDPKVTAEVTITVKPATTNPDDGKEIGCEVDYETFTLKVTKAGDAKYAFLEVWKFGTNDAKTFDKSDSSKDKLSNTYSYELTGGEVTIDLSFLKASTIQGIKVYTDKNTTKTEKVIAAQPGKLGGLKYNSAKKEWDITKAKEGKTQLTAATFKPEDYEYRGQYSKDWDGLENFGNVNHISAGSTIIVRKEAVKDGVNAAPAGPEAKVKITAAAKAPKIAVDYAKGTVKFSDKMQYGTATKAFDTAPKTAQTLTALRTTMGADATKELVVFAYTKGDESKGKPNSNVASVIIPADKEFKDTDKTIAVTGEQSSITYKLSDTGSGDRKQQVYEFSVTGSDAFEISEKASTESDRKWKKVDSKKAYSIVLGDSEKTVYVRRAGHKGKAKDGSDSYFPSAECPVTIPKKSENNDDANKMEKPSADAATGQVKIGTDLVATFTRNATTKTIIDVAVESGKGNMIEYSKDGGTTWNAVTAETTKIEGVAEEAVTLKIRAAASGDKKASDAVDLVIAKAALPAADAPVADDSAGTVSIDGTVAVTFVRDGSDSSQINITVGTADVIEYSVDEGKNWIKVTASTTSITGATTTGTVIKVRVAGTENASASEAVDLTIS